MRDEIKATTWAPEDTVEYLKFNPFPVDFFWKNREGKVVPVQPTYSIINYGKWLKETPYFPGLFELVHDLLFRCGKTLPDLPTLTAQLRKIHLERVGQLQLF